MTSSAPIYCAECDTVVPNNGTHVHDAFTRAAQRELDLRDEALTLIRKGENMPEILSAGAHRTHAGKLYIGRTAGCPTFRCGGCGELVFVPEADLAERGYRVAK